MEKVAQIKKTGQNKRREEWKEEKRGGKIVN